MKRMKLRRSALAPGHAAKKRPARAATRSAPPLTTSERICGPYAGYYLASYATRLEDGQYIAYCKICPQEPASYWDAAAVEKISTQRHATPAAAFEEAEDLGLRCVIYWLNEFAE